MSLASITFAGAALAQPKTIAVYVEGPDAGRVRRAVHDATANRMVVADETSFRAELARVGQTKPFGKDLDPKAIDRVRRAGRAIGAAAVLLVRMRRDDHGLLALLLVVDVSDAAPVTRGARLAFKSNEKDSREIASALGDSLDKYESAQKPPAKPGPPGAEVKEAPTATPPAATTIPPGPPNAMLPETVSAPPLRSEKTPAQAVATSLLDVAPGGEASGRQFKYVSGIERTPDVYRLFPALTAAITARVFPLASMGGPWGDVGLAGDYSLTVLQTRDLRGASSSAAPTSHSLGACARLHPGTAARFLLSACVGYALTSFGKLRSPASELPDVSYRSVRPALDARVTFGRFSVFGVAAFRAILDSNAISARFYNPIGYGFDGELGGGFMVVRRFEIRLFGRYESYSFSFRPPQGATFAAGSTLDQLYGIRLSLAFVF